MDTVTWFADANFPQRKGLSMNWYRGFLATAAGIGIAMFSSLAAAYVGGSWTTYNTGNSGIASNDVRAIGIDGYGFMWFGTANGLSRFDGTTWKTFTTSDKLAHNTVNAIAHEKTKSGADELWVATDGGVSVLGVKPDAVSFATPYTTTNSKYPGMISDKVVAATVDSQHVRWFGSDQGLMSFDGKKWVSYTTADKLAGNRVNALAYEETSYGPEIWAGTDAGISVINTTIDAVSFATPYTTTNSKYPGMISDMINSATVDTIHGLRWFGTDKGLISFGSAGFKSYTTDDFLSSNVVTSGAVGPDGILYFGTEGGGVSRFDGVTGASPLNTDWSGIASNNVRAISVRKGGAVWFATDQGVTKWIPEGAVEDTVITGVEERRPASVAIRGIYPNPFNPTTSIEFSVPASGHLELSLYNLAGQKVRELVSGVMSAGVHTVKWDGKDMNGATVASGTYIAQLRMGNTVVNRKMALVK